ncbi:MAG: (2Fe-2S)-binding protein [Blastocatellia bacterium]|nr:(2Fe-2S)-binding protein [Blastocatellia bacterium]
MTSERSAYSVSFSPESHPPVRLASGSNLSEYLSVENSPVLFGCRNGVCGTCLIEVQEEMNGRLREAADDEREMLDILAPDNPRARLACQVALCADIKIRYLGFASL